MECSLTEVKDTQQLLDDYLKARTYIAEIEQAFRETQQQLFTVVNELHDVKQQLLQANSQLAVAEEAKLVADKERSDMEAELKDEREKVHSLNGQIEAMKSESGNSREMELQVKISALNTEIKRGRSRIAAAEAARIRAMVTKNGMYLAMQRLAVAAMEKPKLKTELEKIKENEGFCTGLTVSTESDSLTPRSIISDAITMKDGSRSSDEITEQKFLDGESARRREMEQQRAKEGIEEKLKKWKQKHEKAARENREIEALDHECPKRSKSLQALLNKPMSSEKHRRNNPLAKFLSMKI